MKVYVCILLSSLHRPVIHFLPFTSFTPTSRTSLSLSLSSLEDASYERREDLTHFYSRTCLSMIAQVLFHEITDGKGNHEGSKYKESGRKMFKKVICSF